MKRVLILLFTLGIMAGCASEPASEGVNKTKAAEANANLGLRYMQQGNYQLALEKLKKALNFNHRYGPAHHYLAELYRRLGQNEKADEHYQKALEYSQEDSALYNNYGIFLCGIGRHEEGQRQLLNVLNNPVYPQQAQVYENLGLCVEAVDTQQADKYLRTALRMNPRLPNSLLAMARLSFKGGEYLSARAYLQRYLEVGRHNAESLWLGIRTERQLGDSNAVASYGLLLKSKFPDSEETRLYLKSGE